MSEGKPKKSIPKVRSVTGLALLGFAFLTAAATETAVSDGPCLLEAPLSESDCLVHSCTGVHRPIVVGYQVSILGDLGYSGVSWDEITQTYGVFIHTGHTGSSWYYSMTGSARDATCLDDGSPLCFDADFWLAVGTSGLVGYPSSPALVAMYNEAYQACLDEARLPSLDLDPSG